MKETAEFTDFSTKADDQLSDDINDLVLCKIIENLSSSINHEFNKGTSSENLFIMPELSTLSTVQKAQLCRDLSELLHNSRNLRDSINIRESLESLRHFREVPCSSDLNLLTHLQESKELILTKQDAKSLVNLILEYCSESESWKAKHDLADIQDKFIFASKRLYRAEKDTRKNKDALIQQLNQKISVESDIELLKTKEKMMEKQLEEVLIDQFIIEEQNRQLLSELEDTNGLIRQIEGGMLKY